MPAAAPPVPAPLSRLAAAYRSGALTPAAVVERIVSAWDAEPHDPAWIERTDPEDLMQAARRLTQARAPADFARFPLYGVPFAVKDNIDVAGRPTTAACPAFAHTPARTATVVERLLEAGALLVGKTNLDQFATGLAGTRSPYGAVPNVFDPAWIAGGSSSGSASVVARGLVSFALGTDTAGSGRVPAGFNNIVGLKPTRGSISTTGVLPACRTLDCVSIFALTCDDAAAVLGVAAGFDAADPYSRPPQPCTVAGIARVGVPRAPDFRGDAAQAAAFDVALERARALGLELVELDFEAFDDVARLLYEGPWIAERYAAIRAFFDASEAQVEPSVRALIARGRDYSAADAFAGRYRLAELRRRCERLLARVDALLVPTAPTIHRLDTVAADPIARNSELGRYTNFVNLLDLAALAVPASLRADGLPFGVTFIAPAWCEAALLQLGRRWQRATGLALGATGALLPPATAAPAVEPPAPQVARLAVVGAHLSGMPLNGQLTERHAVRIAQTTTAPRYRLFALPGTAPPKPGLLRDEAGGAPIAVEVWDVPLAHFGSFVAAVPPPLAIGSVELADGSRVKGFVCEPYALAGATDITSYGGWRGYVASAAHSPSP